MKEYILKTILFILKIFYYISDPFYRIYIGLNYSNADKKKLPRFSSKLLEIPAIDLAIKIRSQEVNIFF